MPRIIHSIVLIFLLVYVLPSCGKHLYVMKGKEITRYAASAKEPSPAIFIVYDNGDTALGTVLKKKKNIVNGKHTWTMDDKVVSHENIRAYQDKYAFRLGEYTRILKGKMNLFLYQEENMNPTTRYNSHEVYRTKAGSGYVTTFYMCHAGETPLEITYVTLRAAMEECPAAAAQVKTEFAGRLWERKPNLEINDYRAIIRILNIYNNCQ